MIQEIIEQNKMIAEFMGIEKITYSDTPTIERFRFGNSMLFEIDMKYHTSWDWLMPVVEKIQKIIIPKEWLKSGWDLSIDFAIFKVGAGLTIGDNDLHISDSGINTKSWNNAGKSMLENTYSAVIQFIQWYNQNLPK